ncbi:histone-lysine N-methyltransferase 2C-like isoform X2 [Culicoides brevitarsis]|uniref:histone-lysine N-methyltransferase 2C-like isoform X2 n=1 Tax=Culicoides brevitarsis TaxID=469753 RepID=UPI00307BE9C8
MDTGTFDLPNDIFDPDLAYLNDDIIDPKVELENVAKQVDASVTLEQNTALTKIVKKTKPSTSSQPVLGNLKVQVRKRSSGELLSLLSGEQSPDDKPGTSSSTDVASNLMPAPEEPCYFPEKWPGKVCILCNLGERSQLGQGEMLRMEAVEEEAGNGNLSTLTTEEKADALSQEAEKAANALTAGILASNKRQKGVNKCKVPAANAEYVDELERIGHTELSEFSAFVDSGHYYVHRSCAIWSFGVQREANGSLTNVLAVVTQALKAKCSYCSRYGASLVCKMSCSKNFHFPCVAAAGGFQVIQSFTSFCKEHLGQVPLVCTDDINCRVCSGLGDVGNLMMCSRCGDHYHGSCKGIAQLPGARAGWQCDSCRMCQICRVPDSAEGRLLSCELCDKVYHVNCIRPVMTSVPKYGWKCRCCRVCTDCGARTPGAGASSRWHNHYTVCDSCYQQRNKGYSCPVCNRAYRAAAYREMVKCSACQKFVHATCDPDAELTTYQAKKETNPEYEYVCGPCNKLVHTGRIAAAMRRNSTLDDESVGSQENFDMDMEIEEIKISASDIGLGKGKPTSLVASKIAKKRLGLHHGAGITKAKVAAGKLPYLKKQRFGDFGRKKSMKSKTATGVFGTAGVSLQKPLADINKSATEDDANDNRLVLCSAKDKFVLTQDICVMCGAIGTDHEGCLISCAQCGQCYHPYCINIKITKVILEKGWRCLDCTVCEGCGQKNDEARLILCDDCDVSYHTYCMDPPLDFVPHGNWKCKWCASCQKCGGNVPGFNCTWMNSYTECGPCASQTSCCVCEEGYADGELIIQCTQCDRWLHCLCDTIRNEAEADKCSEEGYSCPLCRPAGVPPPHLRPKKKVPEKSSKTPTSKTPDGDKDYPLSLEGTHFLDGVCLNDHGLNQIKYLQAELSKQRPKRKPKTAELPPPLPKDDGILAAIESVVASTSLDNSMEDVKVDMLDPKEEAEIYKDGMPWTTTDPPPEGFSVFTTEQGTVVLRKKRQRNLQKLGIGGFAVRNRNFRQKDEGEDFESMAQTMDQSNTCDVVDTPTALNPPDLNKNKKKQQRKKNKSKLIETYPNYLQEAFFGKSLLDPLPQVKFEIQSSDDELKTEVSDDKTIKLNADELKLIEAVKCKNEQENSDKIEKPLENKTLTRVQEIKKEEAALDDDENNSDTEALKEMLGLPNDLVDNDLITSIMNEDELSKASAGLDDVTPKDELADMLTDPHFNLDSLGTMDGKDVEEIFKGVLTDESQESQESIFANSVNSGMTYSRTSTPQHVANIQSPSVMQSPSRLVPQQQQQPLMQAQQNIIQTQPNQMIAQQIHTTAIPQQQQIRTMPGGQQYHVTQGQISQMQPGMVQQQTMQMQGPQGVPQQQQQQQNIPIVGQVHQMNRGNQFSPLYGPNGEQLQPAQNIQPVQGNPQQWQQNVNISNQQMSTTMVPVMDVNMVTGQVPGGDDMSMSSAPLSYNQKNSERMRLDEALNNDATISCVLYANTNHPELRNEYPIWADRFKQILKKWRTLSNEQKQPYLTKARENRSAIRMKKAQQVQPQSSPKESSSSNPSPATTPQTIIPNTPTDQLDQGQTIIVQHAGPNAQQIHLVGAQQQTQQLNTVQQQPNVVLPAASPIQQSPVSQQQLIEDQEKINAQQKSQREAEQENKWKQMQAHRAREQQMQQQLSFNPDPNGQPQLQQPNIDINMSPNSRQQFVTPINKIHPSMTPQSPNAANFQHPGMQRQMSQPNMMPRQMNPAQQRPMNQSPFSPQTPGTPQSPHDLFPNPPVQTGVDQFQRPEGNQDVFQSPQPQRVGQESPNQTANRSPAYQMAPQSSQPQPGYAPGTPRPNFSTNTVRPTVYARPGELFIPGGNNTPPFQSPRAETFQQPSPQEGNRQLRDLLQRQQAPTQNQQSPNPAQSPTQMFDNQSNLQSPVNAQNPADNFRQPLPPGMIQRPTRMPATMMSGGTIIRNQLMQGGQIVQGPRAVVMTGDVRQKFLRQGNVITQQQVIMQGGQQFIIGPQGQRMPVMQQQTMQQSATGDQNILLQQRLQQRQVLVGQQNMQQIQTNQQITHQSNIQGSSDPASAQSTGEQQEIPDIVTAEIEKLEREQEETGEVEGVGEFLTKLEDDDDELLVSLTTDMGDDFNLLEYADPELEGDGEKSNFLDSLDLDEPILDVAMDKTEEKKVEQPKVVPKQTIPQQASQPTTNIQMNQQIQMQGNMQQNIIQQQGQQTQHVIVNTQQAPGQTAIHRFKTLPQGQITQQMLPANFQQIQQQMLHQIQQAAAMGKPMAPGTQLQMDGVIGIVTANNGVQISLPNMINRQGIIQNRPGIQHIRMQGQNIPGQQGPRMMHIQGTRIIHQTQLPQQTTTVVQNQQNTLVQQLQQPSTGQSAAPPPPYPEPPPPYPGANAQGNQEQPLLLEELVEQEKREQAQGQPGQSMINPSLVNNPEYEKIHADLVGSTSQMLQNNQQIMTQPGIQRAVNNPGIRAQFMPRGVQNMQQGNWRPQMPQTPSGQPPMSSPTISTMQQPPAPSTGGTIQQTVPLYQANFQPAPPVPPENIQSEADERAQKLYEQWLESHNIALTNQLNYYETEVQKLRKARKTLNSKQRQLKKTGADLSDEDQRELAKVLQEQSIIQKQLEQSRKQMKQHTSTKQEYESKKMAKLQPQGQPGQSPAHMENQSQLMHPGQSPMNPQMMHQPVPSPLQSPSPLMASQSPGPSILQSPSNHNSQSAMSPYNTMSQSPRIGTPHTPIDDNPFSPNNMVAGPSPSPSLQGRLTSPAPRMTSPQHRMAAPVMAGGRLITASPGQQFQGQQNIVVQSQFQNQMQQPGVQMQGQMRFVRPQMMSNDPNLRMRMPANFQQGQIQQIRQVQQGYTSPIGSPQSTQMQIQQQQQPGMGDGMIMQNNRGMQQMVQQRQMMQQRQMQQQMQVQNNQNMQVMNSQMMNQQQNQQTIVQMQQNQYARQSPIHQQPPSPLLSQNNPNSPMTPRSPMVNYGQQQQQQNPTSPMMMGNSPLMRRPPSTGLPERPQSVESSPRMNQYGMDQSSGGGGGNIPGNPIPCLPPADFFYRKPGLRGGTPMWGAGRGKRPPGPQNTRQGNAKTTIVKNKPILIVNTSQMTASSSAEQGQSSSASDKRAKLQKQESVVIVDSSPERMMDYDDDNDKSLVAAEVSLSSVAQHIGENDEIHIEQYNSGFDNIASSPLDGTEANDEYVLFNSDVVNYDDESLRTKETNMAEEESQGEIRIIETPNVEVSSEVVRVASAKVTATTEDFEAMIDHGSKDGDGVDNKSASTSTKQTIAAKQEPPVITISQAKVPASQIQAQQIQQKQTTYSRTIIPGNLLSGATIVTSSAAAVAAHKKDGTQTTAKVSIGNKTIHVPVLKSGFLQQGTQQQGKQIQMKKIGPQSSINLIKNPTIIQVGNRSIKNPNIVTLSSLNLTTPINPAILTKAFIRPMNANVHKVDVVTTGDKSKTQITQIQQHATQSTATVNEKFIQIQTKPSSSQATMSFTKLSSLMMTQDASLPTKIFEDESVSPDNSTTEVAEDTNNSITVTKKVVEQKQVTSKSDDKGDSDELMDMMASITGESKLSPPTNVQQVKSDVVNTDDLVSTLSDNSQDSKDGIKVVQASPNSNQMEGKKQGVIPVHVIIKSRESSSSPILQGNVGQRLVSVVPQLSPLSQPNELTQNVTNVSQQLRNIMSSINPGTTISQNTNQNAKKEDSETKPETTIQKQIVKTEQSQQGTILATHLQQISSQPPISAPLTSQQGNIVVVKHIRNPNTQDGQGNNGQTIVVMSQPQMLPGNNSVIITQGALNKQQTSILSNQLQGVTQQGVTRIINYSENQSQPPALVVTGRQGVTGQQIAVASSSGGSILSATLSQPPVSKTVNVSNATITNLLQTQLTSPSFRRSKSTDEVPAFMKDNIPGHITGIKRHSIEASSIKPEPMDTDENNVSSTTTSVTLSSKPNEASSSNSITIVTNRITSMPAPQVKQDNESQNVLLKQLLQNSGSSVSVTPTTTTLTNRPLSTVLTSQSRAPSLGFASSLEDQLSRPVIPPNLNQPVSISSSSASLMNTQSINKTTITTQSSTDSLKSNIVTSKLVTRETSFVSKPATTSATPTVTTQSFVTPLHNSHNQSSVSEIRKIIGSTFANKDEGSSFLSSSILQTSKLAETSRESPPVSKTSETTETSQTLPPTTQQEQMPRIDGSISSGPPPNVVIKKEDMVPTNILQSSLAAQQQRTTTIENPNTPAAISAILSQSLNQQQQQSTIQPASQVTTTMTPVTVQSTTIMKVDPNSAVVTTNQPQAPEMIIKQEIKIEKDIEGHQDSLGSNITPTMEIKKEIIGMPQMQPTTGSFMSQNTPTTEKTREEIEAEIKERELAALELKKKKRREYQKNRRQQQLLKNEQLKTLKKTKKPSKYEEDYDTFIDNLITQIRQLPPMQVLEPLLPRNYNVCAMHGTGDLSKFSTQKNYSFINGDLVGEFGKAELPSVGDYFNIKPFGYKDPVPKAIPVSTQWGFYDAEFPIIRFDEADDRRRYDFGHKDRDNDTPDSIISSSSPECVRYDPPVMYPGLRLIKEEESEDEELVISKRMSPTVPIVAPVPIRLKPGSVINVEKMHESGSNNKENEGTKDIVSLKSRLGATTPLKDSSNLTVTLTLTSSAAEDIMGVLRDLANILHIPPPNSYQIVERTQTPPSQKLGLYRIKGKDGKEGEPIDIQTILNGNAKFCRHCDVVILNQVVRAKSSDFPLLANNTNKLEFESEDLYFCSRSCYKQFQWRPTNITEDKQLDSNGNTKLGVFDFEDDSMKMEVDADESSKTSISSMDSKSEKSRKLIDDCDLPPAKAPKLVRWRTYSSSVFPSPPKIKRETEREIVQNLFRMNITVTAGPKTDDTRKCIFCHQIGDGVADGPSRLLNFDVDKWVHLNCALWSDGVYETENGALMNLEAALQQSLTTTCYICNQLGATIKCFKNRCASVYHLNCALKDSCVFYKNKSMMCQVHATKSERDQELTTLSVQRRVYVERDECRQVASVMHHSELSNLMRVGSLIFLNVGQILPHQLQAFHTSNFIYPIGYKMIRFYWSMRHPNKRCRYVCSIADVCGRPEFRVLVQEQNEEDIELRDNSPKAVWQRILEPIAELRKDNRLIQLFPKFMTGEDLFGLTEPSVVRILESLPGIETLTDYRFKYGRNPLLELPLAINPSGAARTEPKLKQSVTWKKPHTQRTGSTSQRPTFVSTNTVAGEVACPYSKQFVHSKSSQYKKMKQEWRNNVFLARSKIQGLGLYAARDLEKHTMVIEYIGEIIRSELSERREKQYEDKNRGIYMFRLDEERVVDATLSGGLARYINHSCNPNCVTEIVEVDREVRIIIFAKRRINRGEELSYDYKFDIEDDAHKIQCMCGAPNCRKWMN